jgi:hypothetical protein
LKKGIRLAEPSRAERSDPVRTFRSGENVLSRKNLLGKILLPPEERSAKNVLSKKILFAQPEPSQPEHSPPKIAERSPAEVAETRRNARLSGIAVYDRI